MNVILSPHASIRLRERRPVFVGYEILGIGRVARSLENRKAGKYYLVLSQADRTLYYRQGERKERGRYLVAVVQFNKRHDVIVKTVMLTHRNKFPDGEFIPLEGQ